MLSVWSVCVFLIPDGIWGLLCLGRAFVLVVLSLVPWLCTPCHRLGVPHDSFDPAAASEQLIVQSMRPSFLVIQELYLCVDAENHTNSGSVDTAFKR